MSRSLCHTRRDYSTPDVPRQEETSCAATDLCVCVCVMFHVLFNFVVMDCNG